MKKILGLGLIGILASSVPAVNAAIIIYNENTGSVQETNDALISDDFTGFAGSNPGDRNPPFSAADDFVLTTDATLTGVTFLATGVDNGTLGPLDPGSFNYTYTLYDDTPGGNVIATAEVFDTDISSDVLNYNNYLDGLNIAKIPVYELTFDLISPIDLVAGQTYWLELQADTDATQHIAWVDHAEFNPLDPLNPLTPVIGNASQQFYAEGGSTGSYHVMDADRAFTLHGNPVPNPGTLLLIGAGLLGLARRARR